MSSHRFAAVLFVALLSAAVVSSRALAQTTVTSERPASFTLGNGLFDGALFPASEPRVGSLAEALKLSRLPGLTLATVAL